MKSTLRLVLLMLAPTIAHAASAVAIKHIEFDAFMGKAISTSIKLPIPMPVEYEHAEFPRAPIDHSYWMRPEDVSKVVSSGDLPSENGYISGQISPNVGYDKTKDLFMGMEDPQSLSKLKTTFPTLSIDRYNYRGTPILLMRLVAPDSGKLVYAMYVALNIADNVAFITFRPAKNSREIGDSVWSALRENLLKANDPLKTKGP